MKEAILLSANKIEEKLGIKNLRKIHFTDLTKFKKLKIYISFQNQNDKEKILKFFQKVFLKILIISKHYRPKCCGKNQKHQIEAKIPKDPMDILWNHLDFSQSKKLKIFLFVFVIIFIILVLYFLGLLYCQSWQSTEKHVQQNFSLFKNICKENCPETDESFKKEAEEYYCWVHRNPNKVSIQYRQNLRDQMSHIKQVIEKDYCDSPDDDMFLPGFIGDSKPLNEEESRRLTQYLFQELHYCSTKSLKELRSASYANTVCYRGQGRRKYSNIIYVITSVLMLILNVLALRAVSFGLSFVPFKLRSSRVCCEIIIGVTILYINNVFILLFIHSPYSRAFYPGQEQESVKTFKNIPMFFDLNRGWFNIVGSKLIKLYLLTIVCWTFLEVAMLHFFRKINRRRVYLAQDQSQALRILEPKEYSFSKCISHMLCVVLIGLTFSTGIPLMIPACLLALVMFFFLEKYKLLYLSKYPVLLSKKIMRVAYAFLCAGLVVHMLIGIFILGSNSLFMKKWNTEIVQMSRDTYESTHKNPTLSNIFYRHLQYFFDRAKDLYIYFSLLLTFTCYLMIQPLL